MLEDSWTWTLQRGRPGRGGGQTARKQRCRVDLRDVDSLYDCNNQPVSGQPALTSCYSYY